MAEPGARLISKQSGEWPGMDSSRGMNSSQGLPTPRKRVPKPGPGAYDPAPGDGSFEHCVDPTHGMRMTFPKSRTFWQEGMAISQTRGGPLYCPDGGPVQKRAPSWGFSKGEEKSAKQTGPGPQLEHGAASPTIGRPPSFAFGSERRVLKIPAPGPTKEALHQAPGPGHVKPKHDITEQMQATFSMGSPSPRRSAAPPAPPSARRKELPGPGAYNTATDFGHDGPRRANPPQASPRCKLGTAARGVMAPIAKRTAPGPGQYNIQDKAVGKTGSSGPGWSMTGKAPFDLAASSTYV